MSIYITFEDITPCLLDNPNEYENNTVITTVTNYGYLLYTLNMLKSLKPYGLDKRVFILCIDVKSATILKRLGYQVICIENRVEQMLGRFCPWNSKGYDKICYIKLELIFRILSLNTNVLLVDGDIVFRKNPIDDIRIWQTDNICDVWIQNDSQEDSNLENMCTGYMFIRSQKHICELYDCVSESGKQKYIKCALDNNDQSYFNKFVKPWCKMNALPLELYPNGKMFYNNTATLSTTAIIVHFNWVHGHVKMAKMKEHKMWLLTEDEEEVI